MIEEWSTNPPEKIEEYEPEYGECDDCGTELDAHSAHTPDGQWLCSDCLRMLDEETNDDRQEQAIPNGE